MPKTVRHRSRPARAAKKASPPPTRARGKNRKELTLADIDPRDERQWNRWRVATLRKARTRIMREFRRMRDLGILDDQGNLISGDLPPDMLPGSKTEV